MRIRIVKTKNHEALQKTKLKYWTTTAKERLKNWQWFMIVWLKTTFPQFFSILWCSVMLFPHGSNLHIIIITQCNAPWWYKLVRVTGTFWMILSCFISRIREKVIKSLWWEFDGLKYFYWLHWFCLVYVMTSLVHTPLFRSNVQGPVSIFCLSLFVASNSNHYNSKQ